jgi:hypothetical protein
LSERFAPAFNAVALLAPGETRLSEIFRWLLDDSETHGQGALFRDRFVGGLLGEEPEAWAGAKVACEVTTADGRGRIDLLMESCDGARCVVIENKPWAGWQVDQLARYHADQLVQRTEVRVHALIGTSDPQDALERHWMESNKEVLPSSMRASGFEEVASWLETSAAAVRADRVRTFLFDLADYCRRFICNEPSMTEINDTAGLILAGGEEALRAARAIAAAMPLAMTSEVARRIGGSVVTVGSLATVSLVVDGVPLNFALFGVPAPWAGVISNAWSSHLNEDLAWGNPERLWPQWTHLKKLGEQGGKLVQAVQAGELEVVAQLIPAAAHRLLGLQAPP